MLYLGRFSRIVPFVAVVTLVAVSKHGLPVVLATLPSFSAPLRNLTVSAGKDAALTCLVSNLGSFRVAWLRVESKTILSIHHHVITRNYRISLIHSDNRNWTLHIKNVQESDRGGYMCQINTEPMKSQVGYLEVVVPPEIIVADSSQDLMIREGANVTLSCRARGYPPPRITWRREDGQPVLSGNWKTPPVQEEAIYEGDQFTLTKVSRLHMGAYVCSAENGVPPSATRRVMLQVHFPPMIWIPNQLVGVPLGGEVTLECQTEAYPQSINYWTKNVGEMVVSNDRYKIQLQEKSYKVDMRLTITETEERDFGTYTCNAKNSLGSTEGSIKIYEIQTSPKPVREPSTAKIHSLSGSKIAVSDESEVKEPAVPNHEPPSYESKPEQDGRADATDGATSSHSSLLFLCFLMLCLHLPKQAGT